MGYTARKGLRLYSFAVTIFFVALFALIITALLPSRDAQAVQTVPYRMNFQGKLANASGVPLSSGTYNMKFRIFDATSGGTELWAEQRAVSAGTGVVVTTGGLFSVQLGDVVSLPHTIFTNQNLYFEVELPTPATATCSTAACEAYSEGPMTPRNKLGTSAYAFNSDTLDGIDSSGFIQNTGSPQSASFNIDGTGTAASLRAGSLDTAAAGALTIGGTNATSITLADDVTVGSGLSLTLTGSGTRPSSPAEGALYYDSSAKQFLVYANGKWQTDKTDAVLVAASDSSQADKDAAEYVASGANDHSTINSALTAADPAGSGKKSGKVMLASGTYVLGAAVVVPNNTELAGSGGATILRIPNSQNGSYNMIQSGDTSTGTGVVIRSLTLDGNRANQTSGSMRGIYLVGMGSGSGASARSGGHVSQVTVKGVRGFGFSVVASANTVVSDNVIQDNSSSGLALTNDANMSVKSNRIHGNTGAGIAAATLSQVAIAGNNVQSNGSVGISVGTTSTGNVISGNTVKSNGSAGIHISSASNDNTIADNTVAENTLYGISTDTSAANVITGNRVDAIDRAVSLINSTDTVVSSNQINGSGNGIHLGLADSNKISGNRIQNTGGATGNNGILLSDSDTNMIDNNLITDSSCTTTCAAINITNSGSDANYLVNNIYMGDGTNPAVITDNGTGTIYSGQTALQGGRNVVHRQENSTAAFQVQNASSVALLTVDSSNSRVVIGDTTNGVTLSASGLQFYGTARPTRTVTLSPEYPGATFTADGSNNNGSLSSDFCSGTSRLNINATACAATSTHNYYQWTTTQASAQDYDVYVRYQLPSDYDTGSMTNLAIWGWGTTSASEQITVAMYVDSSATACSTSSNAVTSNATWAQATVGSPLGACTPVAGDIVTFKVRLLAGQNNFARAGTISFGYRGKM